VHYYNTRLLIATSLFDIQGGFVSMDIHFGNLQFCTSFGWSDGQPKLDIELEVL
jgi:hypothetical protein